MISKLLSFWHLRILILLGITACQITTPTPKPQTSQTGIHFWGRVAFKTPHVRQQGEFELKLSSQNEWVLELRAPWLGTLFYEIRATSEQWMIVDYSQKRVLFTPNDAATRIEHLGANITLEELRWLFTGQFDIPETSESSDNDVQWISQQNEHGQWTQLSKQIADIPVFNATLTPTPVTETPSFIPQKIQIHVPQTNSKITFAITTAKVAQHPDPLFQWTPPAGFDVYVKEAL